MRGALLVAAVLACAAAGATAWAWARLEPLSLARAEALSVTVLDRNDKLLRAYAAPDGRWRLPAEVKDVDPRYLAMLIAYEDQRFEEHHGIDWSGMARAAVQFVGAGGKIVSGGSTLTMQVARLLETGSTRSLDAKIRQMVHADRLETELSKEQILDLYLTLAPTTDWEHSPAWGISGLEFDTPVAISTATTPEPGTLALAGLGLLGVAAVRRRRNS